MSSTRTAKDSSVFHQNRYASSSEIERGLLAVLVAKRCSVLDRGADRELIWFIQYLSHEEGGLAALVRNLLARYADRLGTPTMRKLGKTGTQDYSADEVRQIRLELPRALRRRFPLHGETKSDICKISSPHAALKNDEFFAALEGLDRLEGLYIDRESEWAEKADAERREAQNNPATYPVAKFLELCCRTAEEGTPSSPSEEDQAAGKLERQLAEMCLNPEWDFNAGGPWYFTALIEVLREYQSQFAAAKTAGFTTSLGKKVCEALDYTAYRHCLTLVVGAARTGKSFAARNWCEQHPGSARFIEVPTGNDDVTFFRHLARGLGLGNFQNYKLSQIRERVESVLYTKDILLVLDEAQRLWPQTNLREGSPKRITWVMSMCNAGVPICMISTPQFFATQKQVEKTGWNSDQLNGRISHCESLPGDLLEEDFKGVAKTLLPHAPQAVICALADYASGSTKHLAAIDAIVGRAAYIAQRAGGAVPSAKDVQVAMKESVIPSDNNLLMALETHKGRKPGKLSPVQPMAAPVASCGEFVAPEDRDQSPQETPVDNGRASRLEMPESDFSAGRRSTTPALIPA